MSVKPVLAIVVCTLLGVNVALAADKPTANRRVCVEDAKKVCGSVKPGEGRVFQCLLDHSGELSPACRDRVAEAKTRIDQFVQACRDDMEKYCKSIPPGHGRVLSCLKGRESDLAPACRAEFNRAKRDPTTAR